jgi:hypothetical protein
MGIVVDQDQEHLRLLSIFHYVVGAIGILVSCIPIAGSKLSNRRGYTFCFVVACLECMFMPFGTILGILSIIVLSRPSVKELFDQNQGMRQATPDYQK